MYFLISSMKSVPHCGAGEFWCVPLSPGAKSIPVRLCRTIGHCASVVSSFGGEVHPGMCPLVRVLVSLQCPCPALQAQDVCNSSDTGNQDQWFFPLPAEMCQRSRALDFWKKAQHVSLQSPSPAVQELQSEIVRLCLHCTRRVAKAYWTLWLMLAFPMTVSPAALLTYSIHIFGKSWLVLSLGRLFCSMHGLLLSGSSRLMNNTLGPC